MSTGFVESHPAAAKQFHRKPLPQPGSHTRLQPLTTIHSQQPQQHPRTSSLQQSPPQPHSRSASSNAISANSPPFQQTHESQSSHSSYQTYMTQNAASTRRTLSNGTSSTASTGHGQPMRKNSSASSTLQRSVSSRSGSNPTSYVALMRKQKATVWSDRAQFEDPRVAAQQRAAKARANKEVQGAADMGPGGRASTSGQYSLTGGVRSKIRHHGAPKAQQYTPGIHPASGVPMRLSAREVDEDDSDDDNLANKPIHNRSGSGRSSTGSGGRMQSFQSAQRTPSGLGNGGRGSTSPRGDIRQEARISPSNPTEQKPAAGQSVSNDYFVQQRENTGRPSAHSSDNSEREDSFGKASGLPLRVKSPEEEDKEKDLDALHRRGSVDERTMTMRGFGKLFVANPDVDD